MKIDNEMQRYFPDLYEGKSSSANIKPSFDIHKEIKDSKEKSELYETAKEFQSLFVKMMLKSMRANLKPQEGMLYGGRTEEIFSDMLFDEYSKRMSQEATFTLADQIYEQLSPEVHKSYAQDKLREYEKNLSPRVSGESVKEKWHWSP